MVADGNDFAKSRNLILNVGLLNLPPLSNSMKTNNIKSLLLLFLFLSLALSQEVIGPAVADHCGDGLLNN